MKWILLKADHRTAPPQIATKVFREHQRDAAMDALREMELAKADHEEVVLFGADSVDALHRTHPRYFYTGEEIMENLRGSLHRRLSEIA